mmetsp:Transcript_64237/g.144293  ORF Transcript_64237/g.144293 Transcript_64237/m.144293 type:complete len:246 (-) Transcript_64237:1602-2339(-)
MTEASSALGLPRRFSGASTVASQTPAAAFAWPGPGRGPGAAGAGTSSPRPPGWPSSGRARSSRRPRAVSSESPATEDVGVLRAEAMPEIACRQSATTGVSKDVTPASPPPLVAATAGTWPAAALLGRREPAGVRPEVVEEADVPPTDRAVEWWLRSETGAAEAAHERRPRPSEDLGEGGDRCIWICTSLGLSVFVSGETLRRSSKREGPPGLPARLPGRDPRRDPGLPERLPLRRLPLRLRPGLE